MSVLDSEVMWYVLVVVSGDCFHLGWCLSFLQGWSRSVIRFLGFPIHKCNFFIPFGFRSQLLFVGFVTSWYVGIDHWGLWVPCLCYVRLVFYVWVRFSILNLFVVFFSSLLEVLSCYWVLMRVFLSLIKSYSNYMLALMYNVQVWLDSLYSYWTLVRCARSTPFCIRRLHSYGFSFLRLACRYHCIASICNRWNSWSIFKKIDPQNVKVVSRS